MADLSTTYMGLNLKNPIVAGASALTCDLDTISHLEEAGAAAIVICSLFEEQIELERFHLQEDLEAPDHLSAEITDVFPDLEHAGPAGHLMWVRKAKERAGIPVIGSLNCVHAETWVEYARQMADTGVDGLELNFYAVPTDVQRAGASIEDEQIAIVEQIKRAVSIPVSVKLSPFYANPLNVIARLQDAGASGFVLFNRFFQPDIDVEREANSYPWNLSNPGDYGLALRYVGLLYGQVGNLCASGGIWEGQDVIKLLLAGADAVQVVSTLFAHKIAHLAQMLRDIEVWMASRGYERLDDFRAKLSQENNPDRWTYTRAQYARLLLKADPLRRRYPVI